MMADGRKKRLKAGAVLKSIVRRLVTPRHLVQVIRLARGPRSSKGTTSFTEMYQSMTGKELAAFENPQLELYSKILPGGFLHYGYFEDPEVRPESMSLEDLQQAQQRYSDLVLEHVVDKEAPVLDVGAGMGGMCRMLLERGFAPFALTPDRVQVRYIRERYPDVTVIEGRFHEVGWVAHHGRFGTIVTAESLQYLFLDNALSTIEALLRPGGRWVICDYFRRHQGVNGSGHVWQEFADTAKARGWRIIFEQDLTSHVAPSLAFARMLGDRFALPLIGYVNASMRRKRPAMHYLLADSLQTIDESLGARVEEIDPSRFLEDKRYMLLVMECSSA